MKAVTSKRLQCFQPIAGLILAFIIILAIFVVLLTLCLARFCCCCARRAKDEDDSYQTNTVASSRKILIQPPTRERIYGTSGDAIYSTPYSGKIFYSNA